MMTQKNRPIQPRKMTTKMTIRMMMMMTINPTKSMTKIAKSKLILKNRMMMGRVMK